MSKTPVSSGSREKPRAPCNPLVEIASVIAKHRVASGGNIGGGLESFVYGS